MVATAHPSSEQTEPHTTELHLRVRYAALRLESGDSPTAATKHVREVYGIDETSAELIVTIARRVLKQAQSEDPDTRECATKQLLVGGIACSVGILVASATGGGDLIAWGAIAIGTIQFVRGLIAASRWT